MKNKLKRITCFVALILTSAWPQYSVFADSRSFISKFAPNNIMFYDPDECVEGTSTVSTVGGTASVSGATAEEKIWSGLKSLGLTDEITAGILGNIVAESGLSPARYQEGDRGVWESGFDWENDGSQGYGIGLIQWSGGRRVNIFKWMREQNNSLVEKYLKQPGIYGGLRGDDFIKEAANEEEVNALYSLEITYLVDELKTNEYYGEVLKQTTVTEASRKFTVNVEACLDCKPYSKTTEGRIENSKGYYQKYGGKTVFGVTASATSGVKEDGSNVTWIGDSISEGAKTQILEKLPNADVNAEVGKSWHTKRSPGGKSGLDILQKLKKNGKLRDVLVFALGTNDSNINDDLIKKIIEIAPNLKKIVLVLNYNKDNGRIYDVNNAAIKNAPSIDQRFVVADWPSAVSSDASKYMSDNIHPNKEGSKLFVDTIIAKMSNLSMQHSSINECCDETELSSGSVNSTITWQDGWISSGIEGYKKESAETLSGLDSSANKEFETEAADGKGKGPNKITLHSTEGPNGGGTSALDFYATYGVPPHFTIDMHEKHVFQHLSIDRTSGAVAHHDRTAGVQIEIIGYSDAELAQSRGHSKWILSSGFTDDEVDYLVKLLIGISAETGIPLESSADWSGGRSPKRMTVSEFANYKGILGHRHIPDNDIRWDPDGFWEKLEDAISRGGGREATDICKKITGSDSDASNLQKMVLRWAWPEFHRKPYTTKKKEYNEDIKKSGYTGAGCYGGGVDCGGFVYSLVTLSGWDKEYPKGFTGVQINGLAKSSKWRDVTDSIKSNADAKPGDVIICHAGSSYATAKCASSGVGHVLIFVGKIDGFGGEMASASMCERAPMADFAKDISYYVNEGYSIFRKVK